MTSYHPPPPHPLPPSQVSCFEVAERLRNISGPETCGQQARDSRECERTAFQVAAPSTVPVVENGIVGVSQNETEDEGGPGVRYRDRSHAVYGNGPDNRNRSNSESESGSELMNVVATQHEDSGSAQDGSSQHSEFSPVEEGTAGVGQLEESYAARMSRRSASRSTPSSIAGSGSFSSSLKPRADSQSRGSNRSSADSSGMLYSTEGKKRVKPRLQLPLSLSSRSTPEDNYYTPAVGEWCTASIPTFLSVCLSVCPSIRPSVRLSVCSSVRPSVCLSVRPSVCLSVCLSICLFVCLSISLSVRLSVCLSCILSLNLRAP